jgi:hypothetical protein
MGGGKEMSDESKGGIAFQKGPPCSVCGGTGKPGGNDASCICMGAGTMEAEIKNLRDGFNALRLEFNAITTALRLLGYRIDKPSQILGCVESLAKQLKEAEDEYVKLKRQRVK